jgi:hypothetical protein
MKTPFCTALALLVLVLLTLVQTPAVAQQTSVPRQSLPPLKDLLQPDGTLDLQTGFTGSLDPTGWTMVNEPGRPPRFERVSHLSNMTNGSTLNSLAAVPGDEFWDDRFGGQLSGEHSPNGKVCALAVSGSDVYVGGDFTIAGGMPANNIAKWNSVSNIWSALGSGVSQHTTVDCDVRGIAVIGKDVYVGGVFASAGGVLGTNRIARWDGTSWFPLGGGVFGSGVDDVAVQGGVVYVGGMFSQVNKVVNANLANRLTVNNIAGWNGAWFALGTGVNVGVSGRVVDIEVSGADVYVGGGFLAAGGNPANHIAKWNGTDWSALGSGFNPGVDDIAVGAGGVYATGTFTMSGGKLVNYVAKWDGTTWLALGGGLNSHCCLGVGALAVSGSDVYVGGIFSTAGGVPANNIAKWDSTTSTWSALGSGVSGSVYDIAVGIDGVYVGGSFTTAGGKPSRRFALWHTETILSACATVDSFDTLIPGPLADQNGWLAVPGRSSAAVIANPYGIGQVLRMDAGPKQTIIMEKNVNDLAQGTQTVELAVLVDKPSNQGLRSLAKLEIKTSGNPSWDKKFQLYFGTHMRLNFGPTPAQAVEFLSSAELVSKQWYKVKAVIDLNANPNRVDISVDDQPKLQDIAIGPGPITHISISAWNRPGLVLFDNLAGCAESSATAMPESTFDSSAEGWAVSGAAQSGSATPNFIPSGGNPGGYISATGDVTGSVWYWQAAPQFLGDASGAYGKALNFDLRQTTTDNQFDGEDIVLEGGGLKLVYDAPYNPGTTWTAYSIPLIETAGWKKDTLSGSAPTQAEMQAVLASLSLLRIRGDYRTSEDTGALDNVVLNSIPKGVGPSLFTSYHVDDDMQGESQGDGDGQIEPGERVELSVDLTNQGIQTTTGVTATLVSSDSDITVFDTDNAWPDILAGASQLSTDSFGLEVAADLPEERLVTFTMTVTANNGGPWSSTFDLLIGPRAPVVLLPLLRR